VGKYFDWMSGLKALWPGPFLGLGEEALWQMVL